MLHMLKVRIYIEYIEHFGEFYNLCWIMVHLCRILGIMLHYKFFSNFVKKNMAHSCYYCHLIDIISIRRIQ